MKFDKYVPSCTHTKATKVVSTISMISLLCGAASAQNLLINGGFEANNFGIGRSTTTNQSNVTGWSTTSADSLIEVWGTGFRQVLAADGTSPATDGGDYFAEINARGNATLFQDVLFTESGLIDYTFLHRGRGSNDAGNETPLIRRDDTLLFFITDLGADLTSDADDLIIFSRQVTTDNIDDAGEFNGFVQYSGIDVATATAGNTYRFGYQSVSTGSGNAAIGNFIDSAGFGITGVGAVPEPSSSLMVMLGAMVGLVGYRRR